MAGFTHNQLKNKIFDEVQKAFDKTMSWIDTFIPVDSEVVKGSKDKAKRNGKTQMYLTFSKMLKNFNREDLDVLWRIVKARFKKTKPVDYMDTFLLLTLKTMFEHHVDDEMFNDVKLQVDYECEMAFDLLRLVKKQLKEGYIPE
ncbi:hypothetical protein Tco_0105006 [Tanacetum coccineum]